MPRTKKITRKKIAATVRLPRLQRERRHDGEPPRNPLAAMDPAMLASLSEHLTGQYRQRRAALEHEILTGCIWRATSDLVDRLPGGSDAWKQYCDVMTALSTLPRGQRWHDAVEAATWTMRRYQTAAAYLLGFTAGKVAGGAQ